jgi:hypothetical protein
MTAYTFSPTDNYLERIDATTAGQQGCTIKKSIVSEIMRLRATTGASWLFNDLDSLAQEYESPTQGNEVFNMAKRLLLVLPNDIAPPELDLDNDGDILFDWTGSRGRMMTVALRSDGRISYAARLSSTKTRNGNDFLTDGLPSEIIELVRAATQQ